MFSNTCSSSKRGTSSGLTCLRPVLIPSLLNDTNFASISFSRCLACFLRSTNHRFHLLTLSPLRKDLYIIPLHKQFSVSFIFLSLRACTMLECNCKMHVLRIFKIFGEQTIQRKEENKKELKRNRHLLADRNLDAEQCT